VSAPPDKLDWAEFIHGLQDARALLDAGRDGDLPGVPPGLTDQTTKRCLSGCGDRCAWRCQGISGASTLTPLVEAWSRPRSEGSFSRS
jgi:hypothetical protein